jgi:hypothetical protein
LHVHLHVHLRLLGLVIVGPQREVISQQLHDQSIVLASLLGDGVNVSNGIVESLLGQLAGSLGRVENLVIEDGEVESQTQPNVVGGGQLGGGLVGSKLVGLQRLLGSLLSLVVGGELGQVSVVVTLHLVVEDDGLGQLAGVGAILGSSLSGLGRGLLELGDQVLLKHVENVVANVLQTGLNLLTEVVDDLGLLALLLLLLLAAADHSPPCSVSANHVLVCHGEQVSLLHRQLLVAGGNLLHVLHHVFVTAGLLGKTSQVDVVFSRHWVSTNGIVRGVGLALNGNSRTWRRIDSSAYIHPERNRTKTDAHCRNSTCTQSREDRASSGGVNKTRDKGMAI